MYRPQDRGMTVVSKDQQLFEVPIADVDAATSAGFKDLLAPERSAIEKPIAKLRKIALTSEAAKVTTSDPQSLLMNGLTAAEQEAEAQRLHDQEELEQATGFRYWTVSFSAMVGDAEGRFAQTHARQWNQHRYPPCNPLAVGQFGARQR